MPRTIDLPDSFTATSVTRLLITHNQATGRIRYPNFVYWLGVELGLTQPVTTSSNVTFNSLNITNTATFQRLSVKKNIAIGDTLPSDSTSTSIFISNDFESNSPTNLTLRGYVDNYGTLSLKNPLITSEVARGSPSAKAALQVGDIIGGIGFAGYDGTRFVNTLTGTLSFRAGETWSSSVTETLRAGTSFKLSTHPTNTKLSPSSAFNHLWQEWSISGDSISVNNLYFGDAGMNNHTVVTRNNGIVQQGHGATNVNFVNSQLRLVGVPAEGGLDADNASLDDTLRFTFVAGRGSGTYGRRNAIREDDSLGIIDYRGQYQNSSTNFGVAVGSISLKAISDFTVSDQGTKFLVNTINSGTTISSTRLNLSSFIHRYSSDNHLFLDHTGNLLATITTGSGLVVYTTATFLQGLQATLPSRTTVFENITTASNSTATMEIVGYKSYMISKIQTNYPARVRIYTDAAQRSADFYRSTATQVANNSGLIVETLTTSGGLTKLISPGAFGFNNDSPSTSTIYLSVTNNDVVIRNIVVTLTLLQLEQ